MKFWQVIAFAVVISAASLTTCLAAECRNTSSVTSSAQSVQTNTNMKGHIWQHIGGLTQKPSGAVSGASQKSKTLFVTLDDFQNAWKTWMNKQSPSPTPKKCGGKSGSVTDCVSGSSVGVTSAYKCNNADPNGLCNDTTKIVTSYVGFWYANSGTTGNKWIMNTAYPSQNSNCT